MDDIGIVQERKLKQLGDIEKEYFMIQVWRHILLYIKAGHFGNCNDEKMDDLKWQQYLLTKEN